MPITFFVMSGGWYGRNTTNHISADQRLAEFLQWNHVNAYQTEQAGVAGWGTLCDKFSDDVLIHEFDPSDRSLSICKVCKSRYGSMTGQKMDNVRLTRIGDGAYTFEGEGFTYNIWKKYIRRSGWKYFYTTDDLPEEALRAGHMDPENGWAFRLDEVREIIQERINRGGAK
jgi:hypothetical protein